MRNERAWPQQCWKSCANRSNIVALRSGDQTYFRSSLLGGGREATTVKRSAVRRLRRSRNKRNIGSCWLKSLTGFKLCATTCNRVCKRTQHITSNNVESCWSTMLRPFVRRLRMCWNTLNYLQNTTSRLYHIRRTRRKCKM